MKKIPASISMTLVVLASTWVSSPAQSTAPDNYMIADPSRAASALQDPSAVGGPARPEIQGRVRSRELQDALGLTAEQTRKIELIYTQEAADCQRMGPPPWPAAAPIRLKARDDVRALLTSEQRAKFNLVPEAHGGGLIGASPWEQLAKLDKLVHLTPEQKTPVLDALIIRTENLMENRGPEKAAKRDIIGLVGFNDVRGLLTPEQQRRFDAALAKHREKAGVFGVPSDFGGS